MSIRSGRWRAADETGATPRGSFLPLLLAVPAQAERIVSSLATHQVFITSQFLGLDLVLFGTVEPDATGPVRGGYDLVVTVTGPRESQVTRRKDRVLGVWVNVESREFVDVPSYLAVLSTKPFDQFADQEVRRRLQLGLERTLLPQQIGVDVADVPRDDPFRQAFLRLKMQRKLYVEHTDGVTFLTPSLFRTTIPLPAVVPVGTLRCRSETVCGRRAGRAREFRVRDRQGRLRAVRCHFGAKPRRVLRLDDRRFALLTGWFASVCSARTK